MTNVLLLPSFDGTQTSFVIHRNADWIDNIYFAQPGYGPPVTLPGSSLTVSSNIITVSSTAGISPGMQIPPIPGTSPGGLVGAVTSSTQVTVVNALGVAVNATATNAGALAIFNPPPLDLTGIAFIANLRTQPGALQSFLTAKTTDGSIVNGMTTGVFTFNVPQAKVFAVPAGVYVMDVLAVADGHIIELVPTPAQVTVIDTVSDSALL